MTTQMAKRAKYPFGDKIDLDVPPALQCIFSETYAIISAILSCEKQKDATELSLCGDDVDCKDIEDEYDDFKDEEEEEEEKEEALFVPPAKAKSQATLILTESEIRKELQASMDALLRESELADFEEQVIESITHQFESKYFRSPSLAEIAFILSRAVQKMKSSQKTKLEQHVRVSDESNTQRRLTENQKLLVQQSGRDVVEILDTAQKVVFQHLLENVSKAEARDSKQAMHQMLMSRIQLFNC